MRLLRQGEKCMRCPHCRVELLFVLGDIHHGALGYFVTCPSDNQGFAALNLSVRERKKVDDRIRNDPDETW